MRVFLILGLLFVAEFVKSDDSYARADEALRRTLMDKYNKYSLPDKKTDVTLTGMDLRGLRLNDEEHAMEIEVWLKYSWTDPRFSWDPSQHKNIQMLGVATGDIWKPDLSIYNSPTGKDLRHESPAQVLIYPNGHVLHVPFYDFKAKCDLDLTYWPHDIHNCSVKIGSWIYSGLVMDMILEGYTLTVNDDVVLEPGQTNVTYQEFELKWWGVERDAKQYPCCEEPYVSISQYFLIQRNAPSYAWTVKLPVICLCILTLVIFILPPSGGEKVLFGGMCLILDFIYLSYVNGQVKYSPSHTPLIVQLLGQQIVLVLASVFVSALSVRMARVPHPNGLPAYLKTSASALAVFLCLGNFNSHNSSSNHSKAKEADAESGKGKDNTKTKESDSNPSDWLMISAVVDRIAFLCYFAICTITLIRFCGVL